MKCMRGCDSKMVSVMQLNRGVQKVEMTFFAALKKEEGLSGKGNVSKEVLEAFHAFTDVMLDRLTQKFLPKREVDHRIELVFDACPPIVAPYRMAPLELEELRKQLGDLLVAVGYIQPSESQFVALILSQRSKMVLSACASIIMP